MEFSDGGKLLRVDIIPRRRFWPWTTGFRIHLSETTNSDSTTVVDGILRVRVVSTREVTLLDLQPLTMTIVISTVPH